MLADAAEDCRWLPGGADGDTRAMRRLLLVSALALLAACAQRDQISTTTGADNGSGTGTQRLKVDVLRRGVDALADRIVARCAAVADDLDHTTNDNRVHRSLLQWRLRAAEVAFDAQHQPNTLVALSGLWFWTTSIDLHLHTTEMAAQMGEAAPNAREVSASLRGEAENLASRALEPKAFAALKADLEQAAANGDLFAADATQQAAVMERLLSATRLESLLSIPLSPFEAFSGVSQGAEAVGRMAVTADRAVDLAQRYPQLLQWRLRLVALDIEDLQTTKGVVADLHTLSETAQRLPLSLREQATGLLNDSTPFQLTAQQTLTDVRDAGIAMTSAMRATDDAIGRLDGFISGLTSPAPASATSAAVAAPGDKPDVFHINDYTAAFTAAEAMAHEVHATLTDLSQPALAGRAKEAAVATRGELDAVVDHAAWRAIQVLFVGGVIGAVLILLARRGKKP